MFIIFYFYKIKNKKKIIILGVAQRVAHRVAHKVAHRVAHGLAHGPRPRFCPHPCGRCFSLCSRRNQIALFPVASAAQVQVGLPYHTQV